MKGCVIVPVAHKSAISFGLVHIPVGLYTATQPSEVRFNQLCRDDLSRVKYKKVCSGCGKEVTNDEIVKGFRYGDDEYVVVTDEEFESIKTEKERSIRIVQFTDSGSIAPIYFDKTYHAVPEKGGERAFELLRTAMLEAGSVAVARSVLGSKDTLMVVMPTDEGLIVETMFFEDEIKEVPKAFARPEVRPDELEVAKRLIESMTRRFDISEFHDEYSERLRDLIERKINGKELVKPGRGRSAGVIDLMEALQSSLRESETPKKKRAVRKDARKKHA